MTSLIKNQLRINREYQERRRKRMGIQTREQIRKNNETTFIHESTELHKRKYDYSLVKYTGSRKKVQIICPIHGVFLQTPTAHKQQKQGCPSCAILARVKNRKRKTTAQFIKEASLKHNEFYDYTAANYINIKTKVKIICPIHGAFLQEAKAHLRGQGCPVCANVKRAAFYESKGERKIEQWLEENCIEYTKQKTFNECKHKMLLRYDFYLPLHNVLIEFDGQQHHEFVSKFHGDKGGFEQMQFRDKIKNEYAQKNNILLLRIRWDDENKIPSILQRYLKL